MRVLNHIFKILLISLLCFSCFADTLTVRGMSMSPIFSHGDKIKVNYSAYKDNSPKKNDFVVFRWKKQIILKRVVAISGDKFKQTKNKYCKNLYINKKIQKNSKNQEYCFSSSMLEVFQDSYFGVVPKNHVIVLGEVVSGSDDSSRFGLLPIQTIIGKIVK